MKIISLAAVLTQHVELTQQKALIATFLTAIVGFVGTKQMRKQKRRMLFAMLKMKVKNAFGLKRSSGNGGSIALGILVFLGVFFGAVLLFNLSWQMALEVLIGFVLLALFYFWITSRASK